MAPTPVVSVIVPVRDAELHLPRLLAALAAQTMPAADVEVILSDDGSRVPAAESSAAGIAALRARGIAVTLLRSEAGTNAYGARNRALEVARGRCVAFTDADCRPVPGWLEAGVAALEHAGVVAGAVRIDLGPRPTLWALLDASIFLDQATAVRHGVAVTANLFVRTQDAKDAGWFDARLGSGGDYAFVRALTARGLRLVLDEEACIEHPPRATFAAFVGKVRFGAVDDGRRAARVGVPPRARSPRAWIPVVGRLRYVRRTGISMAFHGGRREVVEARPTVVQHTLGLVARYVAIPWAINVWTMTGWHRERRTTRWAPSV